MNKKIKRIICYILAFLIFACGLIVFIFPFANREITSSNIEENLSDFRYIRSVQPDEEDIENGTSAEKTEKEMHRYDELYDAMVDYNQKIYQQKQSGLKDAWSYEQAEFDLSKYGIYNNIIAELRIPSMDCDLPLYLGATWNNMAWGAVQLGQTSMPVGGENTNCVIAGHRGCTNGRYFLDIENMKIGDKVYIDNLWGTITYKVTEIEIISPDDIDKILIQEGKDMVTLITCHPYPYNYQRYVVYCERTENDEAVSSQNQTDSESETVYVEETREIEDDGGSESFIMLETVLIYLIPIILIVMTVVLFYLTSKHHLRRKNNRRKRQNE